MRIRTSAAAAGLILLAACGAKNDKAGSGNATAGSGAAAGTATPAASAAAVHIEPGEWEMTFETTRVGGGALPPAAAAAMAGRKVTSRHCITPEQASQESEKLLSGRENGHCDRSNFAMADGRIHGTISCQGTGSSKVVMTMDGQYSPQAYDYTMSMTNSGPGMGMTMESHTSGHRIGACAGKD